MRIVFAGTPEFAVPSLRAAAGRGGAVGLGQDADDGIRRSEQAIQRPLGEDRRAGEDDAQRPGCRGAGGLRRRHAPAAA